VLNLAACRGIAGESIEQALSEMRDAGIRSCSDSTELEPAQ
jgi:hypothetical protein